MRIPQYSEFVMSVLERVYRKKRFQFHTTVDKCFWAPHAFVMLGIAPRISLKPPSAVYFICVTFFFLPAAPVTSCSEPDVLAGQLCHLFLTHPQYKRTGTTRMELFFI